MVMRATIPYLALSPPQVAASAQPQIPVIDRVEQAGLAADQAVAERAALVTLRAYRPHKEIMAETVATMRQITETQVVVVQAR